MAQKKPIRVGKNAVPRLYIRGHEVKPVDVARSHLIHLTQTETVSYGLPILAACGRSLTVGVAGKIIPAEEWLGSHESVLCQDCTKRLKREGTVVK